jgi:catechol 2,3-dioxygenase-like lactoylglutathione lyase family enzyme
MLHYELQVVTLPVSDVDTAKAFYIERAGFTLDVDYHPDPGFRVVQLTPPGSACSIQIGVGLTDAPAGSARAMLLAVTDIEAARAELEMRGVTVSEIQHKSSIDDWRGRWVRHTDPQRGDYASFAEFADPDGNTWHIQEIGYRDTTREN